MFPKVRKKLVLYKGDMLRLLSFTHLTDGCDRQPFTNRSTQASDRR